MSLIVEDGTGLSTAASYISVDDADTYHMERQNADWVGSAEAKEGALRRATDFMLQRYRGAWQGYRLNSTQALDWPRSWVEVDGYSVASDSVPTPIKQACAELALRALAGDLNADQDQAGITREKIGQIEVEYGLGASTAVKYPAVDELLAPYLQTGSSGLNRKVQRA